VERKLYKSADDRVLAGVCGGIAEYFEIDSTLVRLLVILIVFLGGIGVIAYIIAWIIIPQNPDQSIEGTQDYSQDEKENINQEEKQKNNTHIWGGLILVFLGLFFLLRSFFPRFILISFWPVILIIGGLVLIVQSLSKR